MKKCTQMWIAWLLAQRFKPMWQIDVLQYHSCSSALVLSIYLATNSIFWICIKQNRAIKVKSCSSLILVVHFTKILLYEFNVFLLWMGKVLTLQEFVCDTFRSKSDLKYKEIIKRNGVLQKTPVIVIVGKH